MKRLTARSAHEWLSRVNVYARRRRPRISGTGKLSAGDAPRPARRSQERLILIAARLGRLDQFRKLDQFKKKVRPARTVVSDPPTRTVPAFKGRRNFSSSMK